MRSCGPSDSPVFVVLAPGDMGRMDDAAPVRIAQGLANAGLRVVRFDAPRHIDEDRESNDARMAERFVEAAGLRAPQQALVLAGISRGARVGASLVESLGAIALLGFAYPFHPRRSPDASQQVAQLTALNVPVWLFQGTRDSHGNRQQVRGYRLPPPISVHWLEDANHALHPRPKSGLSQAVLLDEATSLAASRILALVQGSPSS